MIAVFCGCHFPHGECGLKLRRQRELDARTMSLPTRGVRVEIYLRDIAGRIREVTPHTGSAG